MAVPPTVDADDAVSVKSEANADAAAIGDGRAASESASSTNIGVGVAVNVSDLENIATIANAIVQGDGVSAEALMAAREYEVEAEAHTVVNVDDDTIFVGEQEKPFVTGTKVENTPPAGERTSAAVPVTPTIS